MRWLKDNLFLRSIWHATITTGDNIRFVIQRPILREMLVGRFAYGLDAGCGSGMFTHTVLLPVCEDVWAIDIAVESVSRLKRRLPKADGARLHIVKASLGQLPFEKASFDVVLCSEVLEHIEDDESALREIARVTKPGGFVVITVPHPPAPFSDSAHVREGYTFAELGSLCRQAGLEIIAHRYCFFQLAQIAFRWASRWRQLFPCHPPLQFLPWLERLLWRQGGPSSHPYDLIIKAKKI